MGREDHDRELTDLVQRLREHGSWVSDKVWESHPDCKEAADTIEELNKELRARIEELKLSARIVNAQMANIHELENRIAELEAALKPFAKAANDHSENTPNYRAAEDYFTLGQLRAARKALGEKE